METTKSALYKYTELLSLKKIEAEFWAKLEKKLSDNQHYERVNLKPLIKLHKSLNNTMMKMITTDPVVATGSTDSVDEVEGFVKIE